MAGPVNQSLLTLWPIDTSYFKGKFWSLLTGRNSLLLQARWLTTAIRFSAHHRAKTSLWQLSITVVWS